MGTLSYENDKDAIDIVFDNHMKKYNAKINKSGIANIISYMSGAIEVGDTPAEGRTGVHFHFVVATKNRSTLACVRKAFPHCDVQVLRGKYSEAVHYLEGNKKQGFKTPLRRETLGTQPTDGKQGKNSHHMEDILSAIDDGATLLELERLFFADFVRYGSSIREIYTSLTQQKIKAQALTRYSNVVWRDWQAACLDLLFTELATPNDRAIHWWWEPQGSAGKSFLAGYLNLKYNALCLEAGRKNDLAYTFQNAISQSDVPIVVLDFVRTTQPSEDISNGMSNNFLHNVFAFLESVKNGRMLITKYQSRSIIFKPPIVVCFANWPPPTETMSADRWKIKKVVPPLMGY